MNNQPRGELVPGGLAMVKRGEDAGRVVETIVFLAFGDVAPTGEPYMDFTPGWFCEADGISCRKEVLGVRVEEPCGYAVYYDSSLMPINPTADPLEITQQQECEV